MEKAVLKGLGTKIQVSTRINVTAVAVLDMIADSTGETRTSLAADLLTAAIQDAAGQFGFAAPNTPEFMEQIEQRLNELLPESDEGNYVITGVEAAEKEQK